MTVDHGNEKIPTTADGQQDTAALENYAEQTGFENNASFVSLVKAVGICMILLGTAEVVFLTISFSIWLTNAPARVDLTSSIDTVRGTLASASLSPAAVVIVPFKTVGTLFLLCLAASLFRIAAGIAALKLRGYRLGVASHIAGLILITQCCVPASIVMCVFGCLVYFQGSVQAAFRMVQAGKTPQEVRAHFNQIALATHATEQGGRG